MRRSTKFWAARGVPGVCQELQGVSVAFQRCSLGFHEHSKGSQRGLGAFREYHRHSKELKGDLRVPKESQACSRGVSGSLRRFQGRSKGFHKISGRFKGSHGCSKGVPGGC